MKVNGNRPSDEWIEGRIKYNCNQIELKYGSRIYEGTEFSERKDFEHELWREALKAMETYEKGTDHDGGMKTYVNESLKKCAKSKHI